MGRNFFLLGRGDGGRGGGGVISNKRGKFKFLGLQGDALPLNSLH